MHFRITPNIVFELSELNCNVACLLETDEIQHILYLELILLLSICY